MVNLRSPWLSCRTAHSREESDNTNCDSGDMGQVLSQSVTGIVTTRRSVCEAQCRYRATWLCPWHCYVLSLGSNVEAVCFQRCCSV